MSWHKNIKLCAKARSRDPESFRDTVSSASTGKEGVSVIQVVLLA